MTYHCIWKSSGWTLRRFLAFLCFQKPFSFFEWENRQHSQIFKSTCSLFPKFLADKAYNLNVLNLSLPGKKSKVSHQDRHSQNFFSLFVLMCYSECWRKSDLALYVTCLKLATDGIRVDFSKFVEKNLKIHLVSLRKRFWQTKSQSLMFTNWRATMTIQ